MHNSRQASSGGRSNVPHMTKQSLSSPCAHLLALMQQLNFGRIENLQIRDGEPVLTPGPTIIREHKFGGENGPRPEARSRDFPLKEQLIELFAYFDEVCNGEIDVLEVKHGLPFRMFVTETLRS